jgi:hypothetical protein
MNVLLLMTAMLIGTTYRAEDFHYYSASLQSRGLPLVNKIYVEVPTKNKKDFFELIDKLKVERFKDFQNNELNGVLLFCKDKKDTLDTLNSLTDKKYRAFPVVMFDGIEATTTGEIAVQVHPSVNIEDFTKRLNAIADGKFKVIEIKQKVYLVTVEELNNPSNVLILSNLLAKDTAWNSLAMTVWVPVDGYVRANTSVETQATSQLGDMRNFKVTIDVFNPDIKIRTDLLPQLGQGLLPFPFAGETWFDSSPPTITEVKTNRGKTVTIDYPFRQLQYGNFVFQPIIISYEKNGELQTVKTNTCQYVVRSVIAGTNVDDIQPRTNDGLDLVVLIPVEFPKGENTNQIFYYMKVGSSALCFGIAAMLLAGALVNFTRSVSNWYADDEEDVLWKDLSRYGPNTNTTREYYLSVSHRLNKLLTTAYSVSLFAVNPAECTQNFKNLADELGKIYQPEAVLNYESLRGFVVQFCKDRKYK